MGQQFQTLSHRQFDRSLIRDRALSALPELFRAVWGEPERAGAAEWRPRPEKPGAGSDPRRMVMSGDRAGLWTDSRTGEGGDVFGLWANHLGRDARADFPEVLASLAEFVGHDGRAEDPILAARRAARQEKAARESLLRGRQEAARRADLLAALRRAAVALDHPLAAPARAYLMGRRLARPDHADVMFIPGGRLCGMRGLKDAAAPALVLFGRSPAGEIVAAQRITLLPNGADRDRRRGKIMTGPAAAHPIRLAPCEDDATDGALSLAEGFESALAVWTATGGEVLACLDAGGLARAMAAVPADRPVIVWSDRDAPGNPARARIDAACALLAERHAEALRVMAPEALIPLPAPDAAGKVKDGADAADVIRAHGALALLEMLEAAERLVAPPDGAERLWPDPGAEDWDERRKALARQERLIRAATARAAARARANRAALALSARLRAEARAALAHDPLATLPARRRALTAALRARGLRRLPRPEPLAGLELFTGAAGTGKTRIALEALAREAGGLAALYVAPDHGKAAEALRDYEALAAGRPDAPPALLWRGRAAPDPLRPGASMCARAELAQAFAEAGGNVRGAMCRACPLQAECAYLAQERAAQGLAAAGGGLALFGAHASLFAPAAGAPKPDLAILDEDVRGAAAREHSLDLEALLVTAQAFSLPDEAGLTPAARAALAFARENGPRLLAGVRAAFLEAPQAPAPVLAMLAGPEDWAMLARGLSLLDQPPVLGALREDAEILADLRARQKSRPPFGRLALLAKRIAVRLKDQPKETSLAGVALQSGRDAETGATWRSLRLGRFAAPKLMDHVPLIGLDATADPELWGRILGRRGERLTRWHIPVARHARIVQVKGRTFPKSAFLAPEGEALIKALREVVTDVRASVAGRVLVVAQKEVRERLALSPDAVAAMHFNALRGRNGAEDCAAAVIIGRPQPDLESLNLMAGALAALTGEGFAPAAAFERRTRARRMRDGSRSIETVSVHPDPLGDALLRQIREAEITQAIDRLRLTRPASPNAPRKTVYVLCSLPLDMTVDEVVSWEELQGAGRFARAVAEARARGLGCIRLSAKGLAEDAPGTFAKEKDAENWLLRSAPGWLNDLRRAAAEGTPSPAYKGLYRGLRGSPVSLALMRRRGEGGQGAPVLVFGPVEAAQGLLETAYGPLAALEAAPLAVEALDAPVEAQEEAAEAPLEPVEAWSPDDDPLSGPVPWPPAPLWRGDPIMPA